MIPVISPNYFMQKASYMQAKLIADTIKTFEITSGSISLWDSSEIIPEYMSEKS